MGDNIDLRTLQMKGEVVPERLEYCKVTRNSRGMNYEFQLVGVLDDALFKRIEESIAKLDVICKIEKIKDKIAELRAEDLDV
jgi:hypothetical protein